MTVKKFRSIQDMPAVAPRRPHDPENLRIACELSELAYAMAPWHFEPGVYKFRSVEEAWEHRERWQKEQVKRLVTERQT
jgi:hypothetical protein